MHYKKEHFILLLKDLVKYLSLVYSKGDFFEINLLNTNNLSLNVERPYIINNQHLAVSFHQKKTRTHFKIIVHFERDKKLIMYFDKEFQDIQIFLNKNNDKINIKKYKLFFRDEYNLSSEPEFSTYIDLVLKKYKVFDNLQSF
tara:strand:- start:21 stop:449 length:429 start_codon:yes stop_codon:yes gene_type:complete